MKTNDVVIENMRRLSTEAPEAGTWSLSVSLTGPNVCGKKIIMVAGKERKTTKGIQRTR